MSERHAVLEDGDLPRIVLFIVRDDFAGSGLQDEFDERVGIGLSLTKSIIDGMGGSIKVRSEVGKYTWFIITFVK